MITNDEFRDLVEAIIGGPKEYRPDRPGPKLADTMMGFHGRPMCCREPMTPNNRRFIKRDRSTAVRYRCAECLHDVTLYFTTEGRLHHDQTERPSGYVQPRGNDGKHPDHGRDGLLWPRLCETLAQA